MRAGERKSERSETVEVVETRMLLQGCYMFLLFAPLPPFGPVSLLLTSSSLPRKEVK